MDKEALRDIYDELETTHDAINKLRDVSRAQTTLGINMSSDNRIIKVYPILLQLKKSKIDAIMKDKEIILNTMNPVMTALGNAFNIVADMNPLTSSPRLAVYFLVIIDLMIKEFYLMLKFDEAETRLTEELNRNITDYYTELPNYTNI